jgi:hypothetical protein
MFCARVSPYDSKPPELFMNGSGIINQNPCFSQEVFLAEAKQSQAVC